MANDYDDGAIDLAKLIETAVEKVVLENIPKKMQVQNEKLSQDRLNKTFENALKKTGVSPETWQKVVAADPESGWQGMERGMEKYIEKTIKRVQAKGGKAVPRTKAQETETEEPRRNPYKPSPERSERARAAAKQGTKDGGDARLDAILKELLGDFG